MDNLLVLPDSADRPDQSCFVTPALEWPRLGQLGLSKEEADNRQRGIGGSDANILFSGDRDRITALWREKRGEEKAADLRTNLAVMLGCWTEAFNRQWYQQVTGTTVDEMHVSLVCPTNPWRRCTLDGYIPGLDAIWEAKHTNVFSKPEDLLQRYMPQLQHNMAVANCERAVLSVLFGNQKFEIFEISSDWVYQMELLQAEIDFWRCVETGREPVPACPPAPPRPVGVREVCLEGSNSWAVAAAEWLECRDGAKRHAAASASLKEMVESDVSRAFGHGIEAKRSKTGAITIRELTR